MDDDDQQAPERVIALEGGSNFRDLGGYRTTDGRSTRWRLMFRSGALGGLTDGDLAVLDRLGVTALLDLRCREEREIAPGRWTTPRRHVIEYPTEEIFGRALGSEAMTLYATFPRLLSPHVGWVCDRLRRGEPTLVHCSGGQDRTGVVSAVVLAALGVAREDIVADYLMSTALRRPEHEIDLDRVAALAETNHVAAFHLRVVAKHGPEVMLPRPLLDADGRPKLLRALDAIDATWGSVTGYLAQECGLDEHGLAELREHCLT